MIYFVSDNQRLDIPNNDIKVCGIDQVYEFLSKTSVVGVDTETQGFDPHTKSLLTLQLGNYEDQYVIECNHIPEKLKSIFSDENKTFIFQNAKFDLRFFLKDNVYIKDNAIYDTFLSELIMNIYSKFINDPDEDSGFDLDSISRRYTGISIPKDERGNIHKGLTQSVIHYCARDVKYLEWIMNEQLKKIKEGGHQKTLDLENKFVLSLSMIEYNGLNANPDKIMEYDKKHREKANEKEKELISILKERGLHKYENKQITLFDTESKPLINFNSGPSLIKCLYEQGIGETVENEKGEKFIEPLTSVAEDNLSRFKKDKFVSTYLDYKAHQTQVTKFGKNFLKQMNPVTKRFHSNFRQIISTGRLSSKDPNLQNITADPELRACFEAPEGKSIIGADFSSQEPRTLAQLCQDQNLIKYFKEDGGDLHAFVASKMYSIKENKYVEVPYKLEDNDEQMKYYESHPNKKLRQAGKTMNLKLDYGGSAYTVKDDLDVTQEEAQEMIDSLLNAFPGKKKYWKKQEKQILNGYIITNPVTERKIFLHDFERYKSLRNRIQEGEFLGKNEYREYKILESQYIRISKNYPIQSTAADEFKLACIYITRELLKRNLQNIAYIVGVVHDEIMVECHDDYTEIVKPLIKENMEKAASVFCPDVPIPAYPYVNKYWKK